jgi:hypothetical protein
MHGKNKQAAPSEKQESEDVSTGAASTAASAAAAATAASAAAAATAADGEPISAEAADE